jgi:hypothetical protein
MADESWADVIKQAGDRYNLAPEGDYEFKIEEAESTTFSTGNSGLKVKLRVAEGPEAGKSVKTVNVVRSPKAAGMFLDHLGAVGISPETLMEQQPTLDQIAKVMPGVQVQGSVKHSEYPKGSGRMQAELQWSMKASKYGVKPITEFPDLNEADALGYGSADTVDTDDDAGF